MIQGNAQPSKSPSPMSAIDVTSAEC